MTDEQEKPRRPFLKRPVPWKIALPAALLPLALLVIYILLTSGSTPEKYRYQAILSRAITIIEEEAEKGRALLWKDADSILVPLSGVPSDQVFSHVWLSTDSTMWQRQDRDVVVAFLPIDWANGNPRYVVMTRERAIEIVTAPPAGPFRALKVVVSSDQ